MIDFKDDYVIFKSKDFYEEKFPMVLPSSTKRVFFGALLSSIPPRGCNLRSRESILLPLPQLKESEFFDPRKYTDGGNKVALIEGPSWIFSVQGASDAIQKIHITNNSTSTRTLFPSSKLGSICSTAPPIKENIVSSSSVVSNDKRDRKSDQVKLDKEFKKF